MKLPEKIHGIHKVRDAMILSLYAEGYSTAEIKEQRKLPISVRRIEQILYKNKALIKLDKDWENTKQVHRIRQRIKKLPETKKDVHDWEVLLDNKISTKQSESAPRDTQIIIIRSGDSAVGDKTFTISRPVSVQQ